MDWLNTLIKGIAGFMSTKVDFLNVGNYSPALYIAAAGVVGVLLVFFIALIAKGNGKSKKFGNLLQDAKAYINKLQVVDESNVDQLYSKIKVMPRAINTGWAAFISQQTGYPSDYITDKECLDARKNNLSFSAGRGFFVAASVIIFCLCSVLSAISCLDIINSRIPLLPNATLISITILATAAAPIIAFVILLAILNGSYKRSYRKLAAAFIGFQDALDNAVIIFREEQDEFVSENIEEINSVIEEIVANKLNNTEVIELITTPRLSIEDLPAEQPAPQEAAVAAAPAPSSEAAPVPAEQPAAAQKPAKPAKTAKPDAPVVQDIAAAVSPQENKWLFLLELVKVTKAATSDPASTAQTINELAEMLYTTMVSGDYDDPDAQEIFATSLNLLAQFNN